MFHYETRHRINAVAKRHAEDTWQARQYENKGDHEALIGTWQ